MPRQITHRVAFWLIFFILAAPGTLALAREQAGRLLRTEGSVTIVRDGKLIDGAPEAAIFSTDEIRTGPDSLVELLLQDGSSLHMGPDSRLELIRFKFNLGKEKPSFIARMAKGLFVYISGAISKVHPGAVEFETPDATIGIRGTKLVVKIDASDIISVSGSDAASGEERKTIVINFKDPSGNVGTLTITNASGTQTLNREFYAVTVKWDSAPAPQVFVDRETLEKMIPESLHAIVFENYSPPLPYTENLSPFGGPENFITPPEKPSVFSTSSP